MSRPWFPSHLWVASPLGRLSGAAARTACRPNDSLEHGLDCDSPLLGRSFLESPMTFPGPLGLGVLPLPLGSTHTEALLIFKLTAATWHRHKLSPHPSARDAIPRSHLILVPSLGPSSTRAPPVQSLLLDLRLHCSCPGPGSAIG